MGRSGDAADACSRSGADWLAARSRCSRHSVPRRGADLDRVPSTSLADSSPPARSAPLLARTPWSSSSKGCWRRPPGPRLLTGGRRRWRQPALRHRTRSGADRRRRSRLDAGARSRCAVASSREPCASRSCAGSASCRIRRWSCCASRRCSAHVRAPNLSAVLDAVDLRLLPHLQEAVRAGVLGAGRVPLGVPPRSAARSRVPGPAVARCASSCTEQRGRALGRCRSSGRPGRPPPRPRRPEPGDLEALDWLVRAAGEAGTTAPAVAVDMLDSRARVAAARAGRTAAAGRSLPDAPVGRTRRGQCHRGACAPRRRHLRRRGRRAPLGARARAAVAGPACPSRLPSSRR